MEWYEGYEMKEMQEKYPEYNDYTDYQLFYEFERVTNINDYDNFDVGRSEYLQQILEDKDYDPVQDLLSDNTLAYTRGEAETSFRNAVDADDRGGTSVGVQVRTENRGTKRKRQPDRQLSELTSDRRPENLITTRVETFISRFYRKPGFKFDGESVSEIELRNRLSISTINNIKFKPLLKSGKYSANSVVILKPDTKGYLQYNTIDAAQDAVDQFKELVGKVLNERYPPRVDIPKDTQVSRTDDVTQQESFDLIDTNTQIKKTNNIPGLTSEERRELIGVVYPSDTIDPKSRIGPNGALQIQLDYFETELEKVNERMNRSADPLELEGLVERDYGLQKLSELLEKNWRGKQSGNSRKKIYRGFRNSKNMLRRT